MTSKEPPQPPPSTAPAPSTTSSQPPGLRYPSNGKTIYHRPLHRSKAAELSASSFAFLFSEMVTYASKRIESIQDLEKRLNVQGHPIGLKLLDLLLYREPPRSQQRPLNIISLLHFIKLNVWNHLFGRPADGLERSSDATKVDEYMIIDNEPLVNRYISVPRDMSQLNCAAYVAGIVEGVCDGSAFPARVTAHTVGGRQAGEEGDAAGNSREMWPGRTVFLVKFEAEVMEREGFLGKG